MNTSGVNPTHSQRFSHSPAVAAPGSAQADPGGTLCAGYRQALENSASALCQNLLVDSCMERRLRQEEGGFLESHEVSQVEQQPDTVQKMEMILSILRTKDDQAFRGFIEWLCDSDNSRSWGQELARQAGLSGTAVSEPSCGHPEREGFRRRPLRGVPVIQVPPGPNRLGSQAADAPGDLGFVNTAVRREGGCKTVCQQAMESAFIFTGCVCGSFWGALGGLMLAGASAASTVILVNSEDKVSVVFVGGLLLPMFAVGCATAIDLGMTGARLGAELGEDVGRSLSRLLGRPAVARFYAAVARFYEGGT
ncbi:MAG: hypothetical protein OXC07_10395 [Kistimonas sp.]|nr:hypothetical protein [Kistimonas sp.]